jgi:hypothetical protein
MKLCGLFPNFYIYESVSNLYILTIIELHAENPPIISLFLTLLKLYIWIILDYRLVSHFVFSIDSFLPRLSVVCFL